MCNCLCRAYSFPHRPLSGKCNAEFLLDMAVGTGRCDTCEHNVEILDPYSTGDDWFRVVECQVLRPEDCPFVQNAINEANERKNER